MANLRPADVRNVAFGKPPLGKRGYDEKEVDDFLDNVERTLAAMHEEISSLRAQLQGGPVTPVAPVSPIAPPDWRDMARPQTGEAAVLAELDLIKTRLARIEAALTRTSAAPPPSPRTDPLIGGSWP